MVKLVVIVFDSFPAASIVVTLRVLDHSGSGDDGMNE